MRFTGRRTSSRLLALSALLLVACGDDDATGDPDGGIAPDAGPAYPAECENLNPLHCMLPWPSSRFLAEDSSTETGFRIDVPQTAMPRNGRGDHVDPDILARFDGFSAATSIITAFADIDPSNLPDEAHIDDSLADDSPTVLIDAETGERVAHFSEIDTWESMDPQRRPLYIRPAVRLQQQRRYLVAIRNLRHTDGSAIEPSAYFRALRDDTPLPEASDIEARRAHFEEIFDALADAGVERSTLLEAWDFHTGTDELVWHDTVSVRDQGLRAMASDTAEPRCTVTEVNESPGGEIWREVRGTVRVPLFLRGTDPTSTDESLLNRDASGEPAQNGWTNLPFRMRIPNSVRERVAAGGEPVRLLDYGHGLFGDRFGDTGTVSRTIQANEMVSVQVDWWGWSSDDLTRVTRTLQDFSHFDSFGERAVQGVANHVFLHRAFSQGGCTELDELQIPLDDESGTAPAIDPDEIYYYGNSQGGIFGLSLAGIAIDVDRFVLGVGGMTYSIMIPRSSNWVTYGTVMTVGYRDPLVRALLMVLGQSLFDLAEPATYAPHVLRDPLPCATDICESGLTPIKKVLSQIGRDDAQVPNIAAHIAARTMGIGYASPAPYEPWNMEALTAEMGESLGENALVIYDIPGVPILPLGTRNPGGDNDAHGGVRETRAAVEQIGLFLREGGSVIQTCDGVCDPN